jgi:hypothetical protein
MVGGIREQSSKRVYQEIIDNASLFVFFLEMRIWKLKTYRLDDRQESTWVRPCPWLLLPGRSGRRGSTRDLYGFCDLLHQMVHINIKIGSQKVCICQAPACDSCSGIRHLKSKAVEEEEEEELAVMGYI